MKRYAVVASLVLATIVVPFVPAKATATYKVQTVQTVETVTETIRLQYKKPSDVLQSIREGVDPASKKRKSFLPQGIKKIASDDREYTMLVSGTTTAVSEMKTLLRLLDVKPRLVQVKARVYEVQYAEDGTHRETLLQSPVLSTIQNQTAQVSVSASAGESTALQVTPHINGDNSISVQVELRAKRLSARASREGETDARAEAIVRVPPGGNWQVSRPLFLDFDTKAPFEVTKTMPKLVEVGGKLYIVGRPLYRVEVSAAEQTDAPTTGTQP